MDIGQHIRTIPDFPKPGILFYDISTLLAHNQAWQHTVDLLSVAVRPTNPEKLVGIESRGFLVAAPLALKLGCGFMMVRKQGKLPGDTLKYTYELEYGSDTIEIQADAIVPANASYCLMIYWRRAARQLQLSRCYVRPVLKFARQPLLLSLSVLAGGMNSTISAYR